MSDKHDDIHDLKPTHEEVEEQKVRNNQIIVFKLGNEEYGLFIDQIKEVVITPKIAKIPLTPSYVKGVANIRGNILAIIDLEDKFEVERTINPDAGYTLVVESKEYNMAILVKDVPNTLSVADSEIDYAPSIIGDTASADRQYIKGIVKIEGRMIILIDVFKVITKEDVSSVIR